MLEQAIDRGIEFMIWFVALDSPERHLSRVRGPVAKGGHDIPEGTIRERYDQSRLNLIRLLPRLAALRVFDNSAEADPTLALPTPRLILKMEGGRIVAVCPRHEVPAWAKPIVSAAIRL